jgi:RND family efflux transporter MFP subunit
MTQLRLLALALPLWGAALPGCSPSAAPPSPGAAPPIAVRTAPVQRQRISRPILATGLVTAKQEVKAAFQIGGIVAQVTVDEGAAVRSGQVLAVLRSTEVDAAFEQVRQAASKARRDLGRVKSLYKDKVATREQLEDATTAVSVARAQLRAAAFHRDHAVIRAPADGRVLRRLVEPDELVAPGQPVLVLSGDAAGWVVRAGLSDRDVARVTEGAPVQVELSAWPGTQFAGTLREIASAATAVGTYQIEVAFTAPEVTLRSGLIGHIRIEPPANSEVALIPAMALRDGDGTAATVWSASSDGSVTPHAVSVAFFTGELVAIASGLTGVAEVVTDGAAYLSAGSRVEVMPAVVAAAPGPRGAP